MSDEPPTEHEELGPIVECDSLGEVADFLEQRGHPGPAAAVRTLEYILGLKKTDSLDFVLMMAVVRLRDAGEAGMKEAILAAMGRLDERREANRAGFTLNPIGDMRRMRDQIHANSIGTLAIDGYRITREPGPVVRPIEGTYPVGSPRRIIADWLDALGLAGTGLRVETQEGHPMNPPSWEITMRRGDKYALRWIEEFDLARMPSAAAMVHVLDDLYRRLCEAELTTPGDGVR